MVRTKSKSTATSIPEPNPARSKSRKTAPSSGAGSSSSKGQNPGPIPKLPNARSRGIWKQIAGKGVKPTKFLHHPHMETLGVLENLKNLYGNIGWRNFLNHDAYTYENPTREFLSTFSREQENRMLSFQLHNHTYALTYDQLNHIMHTPTEGYITTAHPDFERFGYTESLGFWTQITNLTTFYPSRQKVRHITHPCWRIAHRVLNACLFARAELSQINTTDLFFLYQMSREDAYQPDFATFFLDKCQAVLDAPNEGDICIGGLITIIGQAVGLNFEELPYPPVRGQKYIDIPALIRMEMIIPRTDGTHAWLDHRKIPVYILPSVDISAFDHLDPETWYPPIVLDADAEYHEENEEEEFDQNEEDQQMPDQQEEQPQFQPQYQQQAPFQQPGHEIPGYFPPNFFTQFQTMFTTMERIDQTTQNLATRVASLEEQQATTSREVHDIWDYYHRHGHFPPQDPPV